VPAAAIDTAGRGETNLLVPTADNVREPQNRRVELAGLQGQVSMDVFKDSRAYCQTLMDKWRQYGNSQVDMVEAAAIAQCEAGNYQAGILVLEDSLISAKMPLPAPGCRWLGKHRSATRFSEPRSTAQWHAPTPGYDHNRNLLQGRTK
jgi:hypothetical protein